MRTRNLLTTAALVALVAVPLGGQAATAATPPKHNVTRGFCIEDHLKRDCVLHADDDTGNLTVRNHGGHVIHLRTVTAAKRYFHRHATPCAEEDSRDCYWDAGGRGNGDGSSFIDVNGTALPLWLYV